MYKTKRNHYFSPDEIREAIETVFNCRSNNMNVELHEISDNTQVAKSMFFGKGNGSIFVVMKNYDDDSDANAIGYDMDINYAKENIDEFVEDVFNEPFNLEY